jgi:hypothetical protein
MPATVDLATVVRGAVLRVAGAGRRHLVFTASQSLPSDRGRLRAVSGPTACLRKPPPKADEQKSRILEELRRLSLERVANELKAPSSNKQGPRNRPPATDRPRDTEERHRYRDHGDPERVQRPIDWVLVTLAVLRDPLPVRSGHVTDSTSPRRDIVVRPLSMRHASCSSCSKSSQDRHRSVV